MLHGYFGTCVSGLKMHAFPSPRSVTGRSDPRAWRSISRDDADSCRLGAMVQGYRWAGDQRELFSRYTATVVASHHMRDEMVRHGVPDDRLEVLPLFSTVRSDAVAAGGEPDTVLFAGRMTPLKGGHVLIAAAARAARLLGRPVRLLMAGDGPQKETWRSLASSLGVPIELTGWVALDDRARVYGRGLLVAVPSLWPEPFGLAGLDAASLGRPAVAFDVGGIREWLADGLNGRLVEPSAGEDGLARAIVSLLDDPAERGRMGRHALDVSRRMSVAAHVERLEIVLGKAAGQRATSNECTGRSSPANIRQTAAAWATTRRRSPPRSGPWATRSRSSVRRGRRTLSSEPGPSVIGHAGVEVVVLDDVYGRLGRRAIDERLNREPSASPSTILVQYVPTGFGLRGANIPFCWWLRARARQPGTTCA